MGVIYHGSNHVIEKPRWNFTNPNNDYGSGFYCTEDLQLAKEWASVGSKEGFANAYTLDTNDLAVLNLNDENHHILNWLAVLVQNRSFELGNPMAETFKDYIIDNFFVELSPYDIIRGYRADDSYFTFAKDFLQNGISLEQLSRGMVQGNLGEQIVLKSKTAFEHIAFQKTYTVNVKAYARLFNNRDKEARSAYLTGIRKEIPSKNTKFMFNIYSEGLKNNDIMCLFQDILGRCPEQFREYVRLRHK